MWSEEFKRVVLAAARLPDMSGGSTYDETISNALAAEGVEVQHVSLPPGTRHAKVPTTVVFDRKRLHAGRSSGAMVNHELQVLDSRTIQTYLDIAIENASCGTQRAAPSVE